MGRILKAIAVAMTVTLVLLGLFFWTLYNGMESVYSLAKERNLCAGPPECRDGAQVVYAFAKSEYGYGVLRTNWCLGVDGWANAKVHRGGFIKSMLVETMYLPCGAMLESADE